MRAKNGIHSWITSQLLPCWRAGGALAPTTGVPTTTAAPLPAPLPPPPPPLLLLLPPSPRRARSPARRPTLSPPGEVSPCSGGGSSAFWSLRNAAYMRLSASNKKLHKVFFTMNVGTCTREGLRQCSQRRYITGAVGRGGVGVKRCVRTSCDPATLVRTMLRLMHLVERRVSTRKWSGVSNRASVHHVETVTWREGGLPKTINCEPGRETPGG